MSMAVHFSSATDRWATPRDVYQALDDEFCFDFDPCPLDGVENGLAPLFTEWSGRRVFCNPDGPTSSAKDQTSRRRLNPRFVEFLMGLPIGWTEL